MGTRFCLGLGSVMLVTGVGGCDRASQSAPPGGPDSAVLNASAYVENPAGTDAARPASTAMRGDDCGLMQARPFVGQNDTPPTRSALLRVVGRHPVRWIKPGDVVAGDVHSERLNVIVSDDGRVLSARCG